MKREVKIEVADKPDAVLRAFSAAQKAADYLTDAVVAGSEKPDDLELAA